MPYSAPVVVLVGSQTWPNRNLNRPIWRMAGQAREDQVHADDQHKAHGHDAAQQEDQMDHIFQGLTGPCIL